MLQKIRITHKKASNKSYSELNFLQKRSRAHSSILPPPLQVELGVQKIGMFEVLLCKETTNYIKFRAQCSQKYASHEKKLQI